MRDLGVWLAVAAGGSIGATLRYAVNTASARLWGETFPWGTLMVNIAGSFAMGVLITVLLVRDPNGHVLRAFFLVGILGAFTTFSTFSLDFISLLQRNEIAAAGGYLFGSVPLSIAAACAGLWLGRMLT